jgi:Holliday junction resolvasome RuvABC endonuclease subunit
MKIPVLGMDPSLRNWGLAAGALDLETGYLTGLHLKVIQPKEETSKQVRKNSKDLEIAKVLAFELEEYIGAAKAIFVEVPVGSQSARAMASYGVCVGILGSLQARGIQLIEVTATEVKLALTGNKNATKDQMIAEAVKRYPEANFPMHKGKPANKAEHVADAIGSIHAGVRTPVFKNLMRLLAKV